MKKLYYIFLVLSVIVHNIIGQIIQGPNIDSCHKAYNLVPSYSLDFKTFTFGNNNWPKIYSPICMDSVSSYRAWFKFTTNNSPNTIYSVAMSKNGHKMQIYKGNCGNLQEIYCGIPNISLGGSYNTSFLNLDPNMEYKIKISYNFVASPNKISIQTISGSKVHSKLSGGSWGLATTWQEGRIPILHDSVFITDGSRVVVDNQGPIMPPEFDYLKIGGVNTNAASLDIKVKFSSTFNGNVEIGVGDTLKDTNPNIGFGLDFTLEKNLLLNGYFKANGISSLLTFKGQRPSDFLGNGIFAGNLLRLTIDRPGDTLQPDFSIRTHDLFLNDGVLNNTSHITLVKYYNQLYLDSIPSIIQVIRGKMIYKPYGIKEFKTSSGVRWGYDLDYTFNQSTDSTIKVGKEYVNIDKTLPTNFSLLKGFGTTLKRDGNMYILSSCNTIQRGILKMHVQDTLFCHLKPKGVFGPLPSVGWEFGGQFDSLTYLEDGIVQLDSALSTNTNINMAGFILVGKNSKRRQVSLQGQWPDGKAKGFKAWFQFIDQVPTGPLNAPLTSVAGSSMIKVTANQNLPVNARLNFWYFKKDNVVSNPQDVRIAQAPSPNGPWTMISSPRTDFLYPPTGTIGALQFSDAGLNLANGNYFAIASIAQMVDIQIKDIVASYPWQAGCGQALRIGAVLRNNGITAVSQIGLVATNLNTGEQVFNNFILTNPVLATKSDTVWINYGPQVNDFANQTFQIKVFLNGDTDSSSNLLQKTFNYPLLSLPFAQQFDTEVPFYYKRFSVNPDITLPSGWWVNAEFVLGVGLLQSWKSYAPGNTGHLYCAREPNITGPLSAHSPYIDMAQGNFELKYSYRWRNTLASVQPRPFLQDTLRLSYSTDCGANYTTIDEIRQDNHPNPGTDNWIRRSALFSKSGTDAAFLQIKIWKPIGAGGLTIDIDSIRITQITSTEALVQQSKSLRIYPNPSQGKFRLELPGNGGTVKVIDLQGRGVLSQKLPQDQSNPEIDLKGLGAKGLYFLQWKNEKLAGQAKVLVE